MSDETDDTLKPEDFPSAWKAITDNAAAVGCTNAEFKEKYERNPVYDLDKKTHLLWNNSLIN